ncbi:protein jag [Thermaerobacter sp. PB12/4term]|uniref:RNA-binding cell elongation regulator Jag/EloR n=1 Tax=Thermaerobacter sp. PB12/4term TaxID=2293838 RepID=UPI000E329C4B|nr:RNA-binding cell elongation regulator Jag/EloR [Thermaerobacter sp. PB12/4term]QIA28118.1 protein jag [Thermaerobacter sp. PB12/4term]
MSAAFREVLGAGPWIETRGRTVEEALEAAARQLGVGREALEARVVAEPSRGFLGLVGQRDAVVQARVRPTKARFAAAFLEELARAAGLVVQVSVEEGPDRILARMEGGPELGALIGRRGVALEALQYLLNVAAARVSEEQRRVVLDVAGYRERRRQSLERLALRMAERARRTRRPVALEPMPAAERRVVHLALQNHPEVRTESTGTEPYRRVVIVPRRPGRGGVSTGTGRP